MGLLTNSLCAARRGPQVCLVPLLVLRFLDSPLGGDPSLPVLEPVACQDPLVPVTLITVVLCFHVVSRPTRLPISGIASVRHTLRIPPLCCPFHYKSGDTVGY